MEYPLISSKKFQVSCTGMGIKRGVGLALFCPAKLGLSLFFLVAACYPSFAQTGRISGTVVERTTQKPLEEVHVFIPNTTFQAFSDVDGNFNLTAIPEGIWEVHVRGKGWKLSSQSVHVKAGLPVKLAIRLELETQTPPQPAALSKFKRARLTQSFKEALVGKLTTTVSPILLNPDQLIFEEQAANSYRVYGEGPLFFKNDETGYLLAVYFDPFVIGTADRKKDTYVYFELPEEEGREEARKEARLKAYQKSPAFYIAQLMEGETALFQTPTNPKVAFTSQPGVFRLSFEKPLAIRKADGSLGKLNYLGEDLVVDLNGNPIDQSQLDYTGFFKDQNPVFGVPHNFNALRLTKLVNLEKSEEVMQERLYLHTDRKHYWPGETVYFKTYFTYGNPLMAEELSQVLHLELVDTTGYVWIHQVVEIKNGVAQGHLSLPDLSETGNFYIRAYTAWSLNYEQEEVVVPIQILPHHLQPADSSDPAVAGSKNVQVFSDKQTYGPGEKVTLNILTVDEQGNPLKSNLSVSVLDANQVVYIPEFRGMEVLYSNSKQKLASTLNPVEKGFELEGNLLTDSGEAVQGSIKAFINGYSDVRTLKSSKDGRFSFPSANFHGEFEVALQATDQLARPIRVIQLKVKSYPTQHLLKQLPYPSLVPRGIQADFTGLPIKPLQQGEIMLEEALVEEKRGSALGPMIYGEPDKVVPADGLNLTGTTLQFLYALSAQVAGLKIVGTPPNVAVSFRSGEPLVLVDGVPVSGGSGSVLGGGGGRSVYEVLEGINIFTIDRIEVIRRLVPMYGDLGRNGIISILLKSGNQLQQEGNNFTLVKLKGFAPYVPFEVTESNRKYYPSLAPFRPTLYWNPSLINDGSRLSVPIEFLLNENSGPILVEVRGITELGDSIFGTFVLNASKK